MNHQQPASTDDDLPDWAQGPWPPQRPLSFSDYCQRQIDDYCQQRLADLERGILDRGCADDGYYITYVEKVQPETE